MVTGDSYDYKMTVTFDGIKTIGQCLLQSRERPRARALRCPSAVGLVLAKGRQTESAATWVWHGDPRARKHTPLIEILRFEVVHRISPEEMSRINPPVRGIASPVTI